MIETLPLPVLWLDESLLVIDKPAGLRTLPDGYDPSLPHLRSLLEPVYGRLWIVHRLDKDTSGVLLLARTAQAHRSLNTQFEQRQTHKAYHALVHGSPAWDEYTVTLPLRTDGDRQHRSVVDARRGKNAVTRLRVIDRFAAHTLLEAAPETGRTHQIRTHLAALGLPIVGDLLYGGAALAGVEQPWLGLHAAWLEVTHPLSRAALRLEAPLPPTFEAALRSLQPSDLSKNCSSQM